MEKIITEVEILSKNFDLNNKIVIDVGCGIGKVTRWIAELGGIIIGIDTPEMIEKALTYDKVNNEIFRIGCGQELPLENEFADIIFYCASFHHVPVPEMDNAIKECYRVLKTGGKACFIEPVAKVGSYFELIKIIEDETVIQDLAYQHISKASDYGFKWENEDVYYFERSYEDYENLLKIYITQSEAREKLLASAREILT